MTNEQKYKTAEERKIAHTAYCNQTGDKCPLLDDRGTDTRCVDCAFNWLALPYEEEKPEPCPFCGGEVERAETLVGKKGFSCSCGYTSKAEFGWDNAISAHNRVARAVMAAEKGEAK